MGDKNKIFLCGVALSGWIATLIPIWWALFHDYRATISYNYFGEFWFEFIFLNIIFVLVICSIIYEIYNIIKQLNIDIEILKKK